jgi:choline kinase
MKNKTLVIVGSGLATRLQPLTTYIPKFLVNIGKHVGLYYILNYWLNQGVNKVVLIVNSKHKAITEEYIKLYFSDLNYELRICDTALGTAHTIFKTLGKDFDGQNLVFSWCDVFPSMPVSEGFWKRTGATVVTDSVNLGNRYNLENGKLENVSDKQNGNVVGIYHVNPFYSSNTYETGQDFVDFINSYFCNLKEEPLSGIVDFGDMPKLKAVISKINDGCREFNSLEISDNLVTKIALNEKGKELIQKELDWYDKVECVQSDENLFPIIDSRELTRFSMQRIQGKTIKEALLQLESTDDRVKLVTRVIDTLSKLHSLDSLDFRHGKMLLDILEESRLKLLSRYKEISGLISAFPKIERVNGIKILDPIDAINKISEYIFCHYTVNKPTYHLIHGDCQFSNTMISDDGDIKLIDPRGYFGNTKFYGLKEYDNAKILYGASGYDLFNSSIAPPIVIENSDNLVISDLDPYGIMSEMHTTDLEKAWFCVIWNGLAQYTKNDPTKSYIALNRSLYYISKFLSTKDI